MGIQGFFNYLKNNYTSNPKDRTLSRAIVDRHTDKYDFMVLDFQSLYYNIMGLYKEINYLIRLLFILKYETEMGNDVFYEVKGNEKLKTFEHNIIIYIVQRYKNLFSQIKINVNDLPSYLPTISDDSGNQLKQNLRKINFLLEKFPVSVEVIQNSMILDIVEHTELLASKFLKEQSNANLLVFFDGIPTVAKMKEQLTRRINGTINKFLTTSILDLHKDIAPIKTIKESTTIIQALEKDIRAKMILNFPGINYNSTIINETRKQLKEKGFTVNKSEMYSEAEHQIMKELRKEKYKGKSVLLASPDADLILLSLINSKLNGVVINIYRETVLNELSFEFKYKYNQIQIHSKGKKKFSIISPYQREIHYIITDKLRNNLKLNTNEKIFDVVYILLLLGDDFIPIVPTMDVRALKKIIDKYLEMVTKDSTFNIIKLNPATNKFYLDYSKLITFLEEMSKIEMIVLGDTISKFDKKISDRIDNTNENFRGIKNFLQIKENDEIINKQLYYLENGIILKPDGKKELLIKKRQVISLSDDAKIKKYLEGCQFIFDLYFTGEVKNFKWYYSYENSPQISEIHKYLKKIKSEDLPVEFDYVNGNEMRTDLNYFNSDTYTTYIEDNKDKILRNIITNIIKTKPIITTDDPLTMTLTEENIIKYINYANVKYIYDCYNKLYLNNCLNYDGNPIDPNLEKYNVTFSEELLSDNFYKKYLKYKQKYAQLKNLFNLKNII